MDATATDGRTDCCREPVEPFAPSCPNCQSRCVAKDGFSDCCDWHIKLQSPRRIIDEGRLSVRSRVKSSAFKGVSKSKNSWRAQILWGGRNFYLGRYAKPEIAAQVYDNVVYYLHKANLIKTLRQGLNFPRFYDDPNDIPPAFSRTKDLVSALQSVGKLKPAIRRSSPVIKS